LQDEQRESKRQDSGSRRRHSVCSESRLPDRRADHDRGNEKCRERRLQTSKTIHLAPVHRVDDAREAHEACRGSQRNPGDEQVEGSADEAQCIGDGCRDQQRGG
jgi:hypothetical protein